MKEALEQIRQTAGQLIAAADSEKAVDELRVRFLGKKGELTGILKQMGKLSAEERPVVGALANQVREDIDSQIRARMKELADAALSARLAGETIDVTLPGKRPEQGGLHPFHLVLNDFKDIFLGMGFDVVGGPEVELDHYNFEMLTIPNTPPATRRTPSTSPRTPCCAPRPAACRSAPWRSANLPSVSSPPAGCTAPTRWTPPTAPSSTRSRASWWMRGSPSAT